MVTLPKITPQNIQPIPKPRITALNRAKLPTVGFVGEYELSQRREERRAVLEDQKTMHSLFDPIFNTAARERLAKNSWYENIPGVDIVANTLHGYFDIAQRMYDIDDPMAGLMQMLRTFGDTMDIIPLVTTKALMYMDQNSTGYLSALEDLTGFGTKDGRVNYWFGDFNESIDWLPDNWAVNIVGEILTDPTVWASLGLALIPKAGGASAASIGKTLATQTLDEATQAMTKKVSKSVVRSFDNPKASYKFIARLNKQLWYRNKDEFTKVARSMMANGQMKHLDPKALSTLYTTGVKELGSKKAYGFLRALDKADTAIRKITLSVSPPGVTWRAGKFVKRTFGSLSSKQANSVITENLNRFRDAGKTDVDFDKLNMEELDENLSAAHEALNKAIRSNDETVYKEALENYNEIRALRQGKAASTQNKVKRELTKTLEKEEQSLTAAVKTLEEDLAKVKEGTPEYLEIQARYDEVTNRLEAITSEKEELLNSINDANNVYNNFNILEEFDKNPEIFGDPKNRIINETQRQRATTKLEDLQKQVDELDVKIKNAGKDTDQIAKLTEAKNKLLRTRTEINSNLKVYDAIESLSGYGTFNNAQLEHLAGMLNGRYKNLRYLFTEFHKGHIADVAGEVTENNKLVRAYMTNFKNGLNREVMRIESAVKGKQVSDNLREMVGQRAARTREGAELTIKEIQGLVVREYEKNIRLIKLWKTLTKEAAGYKNYNDLLQTRYISFIEGRTVYRYSKDTRGYTFFDVDGKRVLINEVEKKITNGVAESVGKEIENILKGSTKGRKKQTIIHKLVKKNRHTARLFRTIKNQVELITEDSFNAQKVIEASDEVDGLYDLFKQIEVEAGIKLDDVTLKEHLITLKTRLAQFKNAAKGMSLKEINTTLLQKGGDYESLAPLLRGVYHTPDGSNSYEAVSKLIGEYANKGKLATMSYVKADKYVDLLIEGIDVRFRNPLLKIVADLDITFDTFARAGIVKRLKNGEIVLTSAFKNSESAEVSKLTLDAMRNLNDIRGILEAIQRNNYYRKTRDNFRFEAVIKLLKNSPRLTVIDERVADSFAIQHMLAIKDLYDYRINPLSIAQDGVLDVANMKANLKNYILQIGDLKKLDIKLDDIANYSDKQIFNIFNTVVDEFREKTSYIFKDVLKNIDSKDKIIKRLDEITFKGEVIKGNEKEYRRLYNEYQEYLKNVKEKKFLENEFIQRFTNDELDDELGKYTNLIQATIYRTEYQALYAYVTNLSNSNYILGNLFKESLDDINNMINNLFKVKTDLKTNKYTSIPKAIKDLVAARKPDLKNLSLEEQVDIYLKELYFDMQDTINKYGKITNISMDHIKTPAKRDPVANVFYEMLDENNPFFSRQLSKVIGTNKNEAVNIFTIDGRQYKGNLDFKNAKTIFIDFETTGLDHNQDKVWQVGLTIVMPDGSRTYRNFYLDIGKDIPRKIKDLTGHKGNTYYDMLGKQQGQNLFTNDDVKRAISAELDDNTILIAHNAGFEASFLDQAIDYTKVSGDIPLMDSIAFTRIYKHRLESVFGEAIETRTKDIERLTQSIETIKLRQKGLKNQVDYDLNEYDLLKKTRADYRKNIRDLNKEIKRYDEIIKRYTDIENMKQETLVKLMVSDSRERLIVDELKTLSADLDYGAHNAVYDTAMLAEIMNSFVGLDGKVTKNTMTNLLEGMGVTKVTDLNVKVDNVIEGKTKERIIAKAVTIRKDLLGIRKIAIESTEDENLQNTVFDIVNSITDDIGKLNSTENTNAVEIYKNLLSYENQLQDILSIINKRDTTFTRTPISFIANLSDTYDRAVFEAAQDGVKELMDTLESAVNEVYKINEVLHGDVYMKMVHNKTYNMFRLLGAYKTNTDLRDVTNILKGNVSELTESDDKLIAEAFNNLMKEKLKALGIDLPKNIKDADVLKFYKENAMQDEILDFINFIDDVDDYVYFMEKIYTDLNNRIVQLSGLGETESVDLLRAGAGKINEFLNKLEEAYTNLIRNSKGKSEPLTESDFMAVYLEMLGDDSISPLIKSELFRKNGMGKLIPDYVGLDLTKQIEEFVRSRALSYIESPTDSFRLLMTIDTTTSNQFYYLFKEKILEPIYNSFPTGFEETATGQVAQVDELFKHIDRKVRSALSDIRQPLADIKAENAIAPRYNAGYIGKAIENAKKRGEIYDSVSSGEFILKNEEYVFKLDTDQLANSKNTRTVFAALEGLTTEPVAWRTYVDSSRESYFKGLLDRYVRVLIGSETADSDVFSRYFRRNTKNSVQRLHKIEFLEGLLRRQEDSELFELYNRFIKQMEDWAMNTSRVDDVPMSPFKKLQDGSVDPEMVEEFMNRIKATTWDYLNEIEPIKFKKALGELYDQGFTKGEILPMKYHAIETMGYNAKITYDLYREVSQLFGTGPEADKAFFEFLQNNNEGYSFVIYKFDDAYNKGVTINRVNVKSVEELRQLRVQLDNLDTRTTREFIGIADDMSFSAIKRDLDQSFRYKKGTVPDLMRKYIIMPLKSLGLLNITFTINNVIEGIFKNAVQQEGGILNSLELTGDFANAVKFTNIYNDMLAEASNVMPLNVLKSRAFQENWVTYYRSYLEALGKIDDVTARNLDIAENILPFYNNQATGIFKDMLEMMDRNVVGKGKDNSAFEKGMKRIFYGSKKSPFYWNLQVNANLEHYSRLTMYLNATRNGYNANEALRKVIGAFFDYSNKTKAEVIAETAIPFVSFFVRNTMWALEMLYETPQVLKIYSKLMTRAWGQEEISNNDYTAYLASRGRMPIGNYAVDFGLPMGDALAIAAPLEGTNIPFSQQIMRKINPVIRNLADQERPMQERLQRMPGASTVRNITTAITAGAEGDTDLNKYLPGQVDPYYGRREYPYYKQVRYRSSSFRQNYSYYRWNLIPNTLRATRWRMTNLERYKQGIRY